MSESKRPYRMRARAEAAALTHRRILEATMDLLAERFFDDITLDAVAQRAGVTVRTVMRRFGSRQLLLVAAFGEAGREINAARDEAPVGDVEGAVRNVVDHYEQWGDFVLMYLAQEGRVAMFHLVAEFGRGYHRTWVERVFASALEQRSGASRDRLVAQLMAVCDIYTWKILRRDRRLSRRQTEVAMIELIDALIGPFR
jgi:AcrR family transcriptional regulator